ncbi:major facilitator superfamily domain-containing protein [Podospora conica]|nr:major facilitator superfamily domain-containing protein [Schizothecium conicum]
MPEPMPEPYQTKLTDMPKRTAPRRTEPSEVPRDYGSSSTTKTVDRNLKTTVDRMEDLVNEATVLANQAAGREGQEGVNNPGLAHMPSYDAATHLPSVHEGLPGEVEMTDYEASMVSMGSPHKATIRNPTKDTTISPPVPSRPQPKHFRSMPGMHSGNIGVRVPRRSSSLLKDMPNTSEYLKASSSRQVARPLDPLGGTVPDNISEEDSPPGSRCPSGRNIVKKMRSCRLPRLHRRSSFHQTMDGALSPDEYVSENDDWELAVGLMEGETSMSLGYDGSFDQDREQPENHDLQHDTDGGRFSFENRDRDEPVEDPTGSRQVHSAPEPVQRARRPNGIGGLNLRGKAHVSIRGYQGFSLARAYRRHPVARDWSTVRKRFVAGVACVSTAAVGILIGIYAGLVPSVQYYIADLNHFAIMGNVYFFVGLAIPTFFFWPLPLLHGRKPYILSSLVLAMPLLFPQAIAVSEVRSPYVSTWRWALLCSRALMGLTLGFASMNFNAILTDLFGSSLMSGNPHQEVVDKDDLRRHGGGMGVWLGIWTWCYTGASGIGFLIGAAIINTANPCWGFYTSIVIVALVLLLNVICPEVRRSPFRRSVAEVKSGDQISRRVARGEVKMHRVKDGPTWWWEEVYHGVLLSLEMLRQPGFAVVALYTGWIYAQIVLIIVLLGSLTSKYYMLKSPLVGLCILFVSIGALVAVPFQKANVFSRGRHHQELETLDRKVAWTTHLLRRAIFCILLPLVGGAYTAASGGPPTPVAVPVFFAALIGVFSGLAIAECNGLIMETFDTSDLPTRVSGRLRSVSGRAKRINYSSFPRVTAGFAVCHTFGFLLAAVATAIGGEAQRNLGQRTATGVVAGILLLLTILLLAVLLRFKEVQIIPSSKTLEMEKWTQLRRESIARRRSSGAAGRDDTTTATMTDEEMWRPVLMGNPSGKMRLVNILELGAMTRWTEIRKKNKLIDASAAHLNRAALGTAAEATGIGALATDLVRRVSSRRGNRNATVVRTPPVSSEPAGAREEEAWGMELVTLKRPERPLSPPPAVGGREQQSKGKGVMRQTVVEEEEDTDVEGLVSSGSEMYEPLTQELGEGRFGEVKRV